MVDAGTPVPVPAPVEPEPRPRRIRPWVLGGLVVLLVTLAAIRGDAPRTVVVAEGEVSPLPAAEETSLPPGDSPYAAIDPVGAELEVCQWDYCLVQDHIGFERIDAFLYEISITEAQTVADQVVEDWGIGPVSVTSWVIPGEIGGLYDPNNDSITIDEPLIAWSLVHELAHHIVAETQPSGVEGHGDEFLAALDTLAGAP